MSELDRPSPEASPEEMTSLAKRLAPISDALYARGLSRREVLRPEGIKIESTVLLDDGKSLALGRYVFDTDEHWHIALNEVLPDATVLSKRVVIYNYPSSEEYETANEYTDLLCFVDQKGVLQIQSTKITQATMDMLEGDPLGCTIAQLSEYKLILTALERKLNLSFEE